MRIEIKPDDGEENYDIIDMMDRMRKGFKAGFPEYAEVGSGSGVDAPNWGNIDFHLVHKDKLSKEERKYYGLEVSKGTKVL